MSRRRVHVLREISEDEMRELQRIKKSSNAPAEWVRRATIILLVEYGMDYQSIAYKAGLQSGDRVSVLIKRFNEEGLEALIPQRGGSPKRTYSETERARILQEVERLSGIASIEGPPWSISILQKRLHQTHDGILKVSPDIIRRVLHEAGYVWHRRRGWHQATPDVHNLSFG